MFASTMNKGFHMTFANGVTVSVQFGKGNYCGNRNFEGEYGQPVPPCNTAEVLAWYEIDGANIGEERGYVTADEVARWMVEMASLPAREL